MRILHFITSLKFGGAESALYNYLVKAVCDAADQHFVVYLYDGPNVELIKKLGIPVFQISGRFSKYSPMTFLRFKRLVNQIRPDVIHSSLWSAGLITRIFRRFIKTPLVCDIHGSSFDEGAVRNFFDRRTVSIPDKIVAVSESARDSYIKNIVNSVKNKPKSCDVTKNVVVIKNGIDCQGLRAKAQLCNLSREVLGLKADDFVVGAVGRLEPIKSYDILIKAFAKFFEKNFSKNAAGIKLLIVGGGSQLLELKRLVNDLNLSGHVIFTGFRSDAYAFYPLFDCFTLSSKSEGLSIAMLEALSFGLPVISTHDSQHHDVIKQAVNGFLVPPAAVDEYADALETLYLSPELRKRISACNFRMVSEEFSIENVVRRYKEIYREVVL